MGPKFIQFNLVLRFKTTFFELKLQSSKSWPTDFNWVFFSFLLHSLCYWVRFNITCGTIASTWHNMDIKPSPIFLILLLKLNIFQKIIHILFPHKLKFLSLIYIICKTIPPPTIFCEITIQNFCRLIIFGV